MCLSWNSPVATPLSTPRAVRAPHRESQAGGCQLRRGGDHALRSRCRAVTTRHLQRPEACNAGRRAAALVSRSRFSYENRLHLILHYRQFSEKWLFFLSEKVTPVLPPKN